MIIAIIAPRIGIKCKYIPARFAPINQTPFIHKKKEISPGNKTT